MILTKEEVLNRDTRGGVIEPVTCKFLYVTLFMSFLLLSRSPLFNPLVLPALYVYIYFSIKSGTFQSVKLFFL